MAFGSISVDKITDSEGSVFSPTSALFRNRIINGDMRIDQRNAGTSFTPTDQTYSLDRWKCRVSQASKYTVQQNAGSVTPPAGFTNYLGVTSSSAYSITTSDYFTVQQIIEGYNVADLAWGTASAKAITISFWVRSSLTGTFGGALMNSAENRSYPFTYSISAADTWEQKSINIAGDTSGTWLTTNGIGMYVAFGLGVGSTYSGTAGAWAASSTILSATGATSVVGTNGATFYITGVQLEVGSVATPFERRPYGTELSLCQRYYEKMQSVNGSYIGMGWTPLTTAFLGTINFSTIKRANPTISVSATSDFQATTTGGTVALTSISFTSGLTFSRFDADVSSGFTVGYGAALRCANSTGFIAIDIEL